MFQSSKRQLTLFLSFLGFTSARLGLWSILPRGHSKKKSRGSSVAQTKDPCITSQTLHHKNEFYLPRWKAAISPLCLSSPAYGFPVMIWDLENLEIKCECTFFSLFQPVVFNAFFRNALPYNDYFWCTGGKSLLKTLWEKNKMLVTSILFFSHNVFYPMKDKFKFLVTFNLSSANAFILDQSEILLSRNGLTHSYTMTPFDAPRKQAFWKHCGKRRNCS